MRDVPAGMVADFSRHAHDFFPRVRTMRPGMKTKYGERVEAARNG